MKRANLQLRKGMDEANLKRKFSQLEAQPDLIGAQEEISNLYSKNLELEKECMRLEHDVENLQ